MSRPHVRTHFATRLAPLGLALALAGCGLFRPAVAPGPGANKAPTTLGATGATGNPTGPDSGTRVWASGAAVEAAAPGSTAAGAVPTTAAPAAGRGSQVRPSPKPTLGVAALAREPLHAPHMRVAQDTLSQRLQDSHSARQEASRGAMAPGVNEAARLPANRAEAQVLSAAPQDQAKATGAGLLVTQSLGSSLAASLLYVGQSQDTPGIDRLAPSRPLRQAQKQLDVAVHALAYQSQWRLGLATLNDEDERGRSVSLDFAHDVLGAASAADGSFAAGLTTVNLGFERGRKDVLKLGEPSFLQRATQWKLRAGANRALSSQTWLRLQYEAIHDAGYLADPYGQARLLNATVPERVPTTRASRAVLFSGLYDASAGWGQLVWRGHYRYFWDNWGIRGHTAQLGAQRHFQGKAWLAQAYVRRYSQGRAMFFADNALAESAYLVRQRSLGAMNSTGLGAELGWAPAAMRSSNPIGASTGLDWRLTAGLDWRREQFPDFTDLRSAALGPYATQSTRLRLGVLAHF